MQEVFSRAVDVIKNEGIGCFTEKSIVWLMETAFFNRRKARAKFSREFWMDIDFDVLGLENVKARMLLNPFDEGFSKEFSCYGFREPLNTYFIFKTVEKVKPVVLDIGSNLGYFPLIELQAGAKHVIALEPIPMTFNLLSRTLEDFKNTTLLNMAISDKHETLKLYIPNALNLATPVKDSLTEGGHEIVREIPVKAVPISAISEKYPINMIRMDVEGFKYKILKDKLPDQIEIICMEFHIFNSHEEKSAVRLLQHLKDQSFQKAILINEMLYGFYPIVKRLGLKRAYNLITTFKSRIFRGPGVRFLDINTLLKEIFRIRRSTIRHLILQRGFSV